MKKAMDERLKTGLNALPKQVTYADLKLVEYTREDIYIRDGRVQQLEYANDAGLGIRCIVNGAWGFAATSALETRSITKTAAHAADIAQASSMLKTKDITLSKKEPVRGTFKTAVQKDPLQITPDNSGREDCISHEMR
jgi:TldD protein